MKKISLPLIVTCLFLACHAIHAQDSNQSMHNAFAEGFMAIKAKNKAGAIEAFQKAGQFAVQAKEWKGCLDAGNALLKLGEPALASGYFDQTFQIAQSSGDWKIAVATGYAYASLPADQNKKQMASQSFILAANNAKQKNDWIGLTEAANGLMHTGDKESSSQVLADAKSIVDATQSVKGAQVVAQLYQQLGLAGESQEMQLARDKYLQSHANARSRVPPPPPGWSPVGESVAGPHVPSVEQQKMARESADKDIEAKNQYILQQEQIEAEHEKQANECSNYFYYPYGYASYTTYEPWGWDMLVPWADSCASVYVYEDGYYSHHGDYTGFGFAFGYSDSDSYFGFSMHVHD